MRRYEIRMTNDHMRNNQVFDLDAAVHLLTRQRQIARALWCHENYVLSPSLQNVPYHQLQNSTPEIYRSNSTYAKNTHIVVVFVQRVSSLRNN